MGLIKTIFNQIDRNGAAKASVGVTDGTNLVNGSAIFDSDGNIINPATAEQQAAGNSQLGIIAAAATATSLAPLDAKVKSGNAFIASSGVLGLVLVTSPNFKVPLQNPSGSGKTLYVYKIELSADAGSLLFPALSLNPTTNLPANAASKLNQNLGSGAQGIAVIKAGSAASAMSGGTPLGSLPMPAGRQEYADFVYAVPAGNTLAIGLTALVALNVMARFFYWEE